MVGDLLRHFQLAAVLQIRRDAGRTESMITIQLPLREALEQRRDLVTQPPFGSATAQRLNQHLLTEPVVEL